LITVASQSVCERPPVRRPRSISPRGLFKTAERRARSPRWVGWFLRQARPARLRAGQRPTGL